MSDDTRTPLHDSEAWRTVRVTPERPGTAAEQEAVLVSPEREAALRELVGAGNLFRSYVVSDLLDTLDALRADNELLTFGARKLQEERDRLTAALERRDWIVRLVSSYLDRYGLANTSGERHEDRRQRVRDLRGEIAALTPASGSEGGEGA